MGQAGWAEHPPQSSQLKKSPLRTSAATRAPAGGSGTAEIDLDGIISGDDALDARTDKVEHGDGNAQGVPPSGSRPPERASHQYYVYPPSCTENEPDPWSGPLRCSGMAHL